MAQAGDLEIRVSAQGAQALAEFRKVSEALRQVQRDTAMAGQTSNAAAGQVGNLAAQFQDIGVMIAAGQNPLTTAIQQGTQISAAFGNAGAAGAMRMMGSALTSIVSPLSLMTIGITAAVAVLGQMAIAFFSGEEAAESFEEKVDNLTESVERLKEVNEVYSLEGINSLIEKYGELNAEVLLYIERQREAAANTARADARDMASSLRSDMDTWWPGESTYSQITSYFGLSAEQFENGLEGVAAKVWEIDAALTQIETAQTFEEMSAGVVALLNALEGTNAEGKAVWSTLLSVQGPLMEASAEANKLSGWIGAAVTGVQTMLGDLPGFRELLGGSADEAERIANATERARVALAQNSPLMGRARTAQASQGELASIREAAQGGILDLIAYLEGTDQPGRANYNETLGYGAYTGGPVDLVNMTLGEVLALQRQMLAHPDNHFNSSAVGRYQFVGTTLGGSYFTGDPTDGQGLMGALGLSLDDLFTPELQDRLALELIRQTGTSASGVRSQWMGVDGRVSDDMLTRALGSRPVPAIDPGVEQANEDAEREAERAAREAEREAEEQARKTEQARNAEARAVEQAQNAYDQLAGSLDPLQAAQIALAEGIKMIEEARRRELITDQEAAAAKDLLTRKIAEQTREAEIAADASLKLRASMAEGTTDILASGLADIASRAKTAGEAFQDMGKAILQMMARLIAERFAERFIAPLVDSLFSIGLGGVGAGGGSVRPPVPASAGPLFGGGRARGGPVTPGEFYVVGEEGPELLFPNTAGTVVPNGRWASAVMADPWGSLAPKMGVDQTRQAQSDAALAQALGKIAANSGPAQVSITNNRGGDTEVTATTRREGGREVVDILVERVKGKLIEDVRMGGDLATAFGGTYGLQRQGT